MTEYNDEFWNGQLFKYRTCNKWGWKLLEENELYFAAPSEFNDPFDCNLPINFENVSDNYLLEFQRRYIVKNYPVYNSNFVELLAKNVVETHRETVKRELVNLFRVRTNEFGIFSMSSVRNNILMWSHYSANHYGFCVGFNYLEILKQVMQYPLWVKYQRSYNPNWNLLQSLYENTIEFYQIMFGTKHTQWKYEKEFRLIKVEGAKTLTIFDDSVFGSVILGCRFPINSREKIIKILRSKSIHIPLFESVQSKKKFALNILPIDY